MDPPQAPAVSEDADGQIDQQIAKIARTESFSAQSDESQTASEYAVTLQHNRSLIY